ncbi:hypothetical protein HDU76_008617 [Blyttiomyces sp. JEL0837]|nr:hypothetical protein HDU76_008617 [Blyttiomyces sp. JEL0837]
MDLREVPSSSISINKPNLDRAVAASFGGSPTRQSPNTGTVGSTNSPFWNRVFPWSKGSPNRSNSGEILPDVNKSTSDEPKVVRRIQSTSALNPNMPPFSSKGNEEIHEIKTATPAGSRLTDLHTPFMKELLSQEPESASSSSLATLRSNSLEHQNNLADMSVLDLEGEVFGDDDGGVGTGNFLNESPMAARDKSSTPSGSKYGSLNLNLTARLPNLKSKGEGGGDESVVLNRDSPNNLIPAAQTTAPTAKAISDGLSALQLANSSSPLSPHNTSTTTPTLIAASTIEDDGITHSTSTETFKDALSNLSDSSPASSSSVQESQLKPDLIHRDSKLSADLSWFGGKHGQQQHQPHQNHNTTNDLYKKQIPSVMDEVTVALPAPEPTQHVPFSARAVNSHVHEDVLVNLTSPVKTSDLPSYVPPVQSNSSSVGSHGHDIRFTPVKLPNVNMHGSTLAQVPVPSSSMMELHTVFSTPKSMPKYSERDLENLRAELTTKFEKEFELAQMELQELEAKRAESVETTKRYQVTLREWEVFMKDLIAKKEGDDKRARDESDSLKAALAKVTEEKEHLQKDHETLVSKHRQLRLDLEDEREKSEKLQEKIEELNLVVKEDEERFNGLRAHAEEKLEHANIEIARVRAAFEKEIAALKVKISRADLHISSLEKTIETKTQENQELTKICDDLLMQIENSAAM